MRKIFALKNLAFLSVFFLGQLYFSFLPRFIQGGDTAELVTAARGLFVAHPPGYPLWIFLQSAWLYLLSPANAFFSASVLTALYALGALLFVAWSLRELPLIALLLVLQLGLSTAFFESALLPDVFSFHALIVSALCAWTLFGDEKKFFLVPFLFTVSFAHHHTIIFLAPLVSGLFYEALEKKSDVKKFFLGIVTGLILAALFYLSLLFFNTQSYFSWGDIKTINDVVSHFLRTDYGTLSFAPSKNAGTDQAAALFSFFKTTGLEWAMLILFSAVAFRKSSLTLKGVSLLLSLAASLAFFLMVNFPLSGMGEEIIIRFHVMPSVILAFTAAYFLKDVELKNRLMFVLFLATAATILLSGVKNVQRLSSLRKDSVIAQYAEDVLSMAAKNQAGVILADNDNSYFALKYLQYEKQNTDAVVISTPLLFHPWMEKKLQFTQPSFILKNAEKVHQTRDLDLSADLIVPNISRGIVTTNPALPAGNFAITYLALGKLITEKKPEQISIERIMRFEDQAIFQGVQGFSKKLLFSQYAHYYLSRGREFYQANEKQKALDQWKIALRIVPWCFPALMNICQVDQTQADCSPTHIEEVKQSAENLF